ncbi:hypothetical protein JX265_000703 [Neoarthrinium moseri]|uniref:Protein YAE1 n=1 Tax=Neoarthrinium moseri TaxID=1658444 RepID=A0A9P9WZ76_9PEZI|nr:hypothetical protein JX265_000703 [Neoarthrinium moseri]
MHMAPRDSRDEDLMIQMISTADPAPPADDPLDDVFGSDAGSPAFESEDRPEARESHPSDVRRLQTEHATSGYREGIAAAKAKSIQAGFDEGFGLGANVGLKAGQVIGFLEGITDALRAGNDDDFLHAQQLLEDARKDLSTEGIFNERYWETDGTWKYELQAHRPESDILFEDVAAAHPLIVKWNGIIDSQLAKWAIHRQILDLIPETPTPAVLEKKEVKVEQQPREKLDW